MGPGCQWVSARRLALSDAAVEPLQLLVVESDDHRLVEVAEAVARVQILTWLRR